MLWLLGAGLFGPLLVPGTSQAQDPGGWPLRARGMLGLATMVSKDQNGYLHYDSIGLVSDLQLGYVLLPWLDVQVAVAGGGFSSPNHTGGLLAPLVGATARLQLGSFEPYALLQMGPGFSGVLTRPFFRTGIGADLPVAHAFAIGPVLGYGQLFQHDDPLASTDARFLWFGISLAFRADRGRDPHEREIVRFRHVTTRSWSQAPPAPPRPPPEPSAELLSMIEEVLPVERRELLAPVLFQFDSAELEPIGIAMLHEVARELAQRPEIELVEVQGYADARGSEPYNDALSLRRSETVIAWLCAHGVAPERLQAAAHGKRAPIEPGSDEASHTQNRRVVFRVVKMKEKP